MLKLRFKCESADHEHGEKVVPPVLHEGAAVAEKQEPVKVTTQSVRMAAVAHDDNMAAFADQGHPAAEFSATGVNMDAGVTFVRGHEYVVTVEDVTASVAAPVAAPVIAVPAAPATPPVVAPAPTA